MTSASSSNYSMASYSRITLDDVLEALESLGDNKGSTLSALKKYIVSSSTVKLSGKEVEQQIQQLVKKAIKNGQIASVDGNTFASDDEKKKVSKKRRHRKTSSYDVSRSSSPKRRRRKSSSYDVSRPSSPKKRSREISRPSSTSSSSPTRRRVRRRSRGRSRKRRRGSRQR
ncbi:histone H5 [Biomphalaria pfeifferi]|uniref:Histone H5 n=1 Tax=Biomphalaria pfeifferi TaxID=112525 RepID=A0AAD8BYD5_BIOPF|nr:histone H5 [Biomphalaria pfeifferi]